MADSEQQADPRPTAASAAEAPAALVAAAGRALVCTAEGEIVAPSPSAARNLLTAGPVLVAHAPFTARRLDAARPARHPGLFDALELFAFVRPAATCAPTPSGLARALGLEVPETLEDQALALHMAVQALLAEAARTSGEERAHVARLVRQMGKAGWAWAGPLLGALDEGAEAPPAERARNAFAVWEALPRWEDEAGRGAPGTAAVSGQEARDRLARLVGRAAEVRPTQAAYAETAAKAFAPRAMEGAPNVVLAEAGTGIGKTLGYLAPASVWAEKNDGAVWVSTYTKALQRQIDRELDRLYPDPREKRARAVVRKGRENYLCLLNYQEAVGRAATGGSDPVALGFVARWLVATRDGDVIGGDLPGWLPDLMGGAFSGLTDRRGECIYSACEHYRRCFIERTVRRARGADIVVANHALVMAQAALDALIDAPDEDGVSEARTRLVFDEGHHLFEAADSAFSACLSGLETAELRRWVRGAESRRRRGRGLETRLADLIAAIPEDRPREKAEGALRAARARAADLPGEGWTSRIREGTPAGPAETLLAGLMAHVRARSPEGAGLAQEAELRPLTDGLSEAADALATVLDDLAGNLRALSGALRARLTNEAETLDTAERTRLAAAARGLDRRAKVMLPTWISMLRGIDADPPEGAVDWVSVDPIGARALDVALRRHLLDPMAPFAVSVLAPAHGALITSATLRDRELDAAQDGNWVSAEARTGARHLPLPAIRASFTSPFDYGAETRVFIVTDVRRDEPAEVAAAYEALIRAAGGGTLGLFTAIRRLKAVHERIAPKLEGDGLPLYAQHVDAMDVGGLVDLFREEEDASLLGTDAVRDGVDVPGRALRLAVFDRVPWPRPDILHKARRAHFGRRTYDDMLVRLRLAQAFGRLIRRQGDRGVFVLLDAMTPSRLLTAFPPETPVARVGLAEAVGETRAFLHRHAGDLP